MSASVALTQTHLETCEIFFIYRDGHAFGSMQWWALLLPYIFLSEQTPVIDYANYVIVHEMIVQQKGEIFK